MTKTINVEWIKKEVNYRLLHTQDSLKDSREALASLLEVILMKTGNYKGFNHLNADAMKNSDNGLSVGINSPIDGKTPEEIFSNTDHTRIFYY
jgi:hypothetical protein